MLERHQLHAKYASQNMGVHSQAKPEYYMTFYILSCAKCSNFQYAFVQTLKATFELFLAEFHGSRINEQTKTSSMSICICVPSVK